MPTIAAGNLEFRFSTTSGSAGNSLPGVAGACLGLYCATTAVLSGSFDNLFGYILPSENAAQTPAYQCMFLYNKDPSLTLSSAVVFISAGGLVGGATMSIAVDNIAASAVSAVTQQAGGIADKSIPPQGVSAFSAPVDNATGLHLGDISPGQVKGIWVRRVPSGAHLQGVDKVTLRVEGLAA